MSESQVHTPANEPEPTDLADAPEAPDVDPEPEPEPLKPRIDPVIVHLRAELAAKDEQLRTYITAYKQATADMERERERMNRDRETVADRERSTIALSLLEVLDNLDRSIAGCADAETAVGLRLVRAEFFAALTGLGVEPIPTDGATFDAGLHEATGMIPAMGDQRDQQIVFQERAGYTFKGTLLRASRVVVASKP
ncbi:MAG: nucleotide exchange factor GrpE [Proteobacteria bacterium]|nr:nucleotide exchange factor GrpE [Pseudomonadota bacterium]